MSGERYTALMTVLALTSRYKALWPLQSNLITLIADQADETINKMNIAQFLSHYFRLFQKRIRHVLKVKTDLKDSRLMGTVS